jgi:protein-disulfide isomerase
MQKDRLLNTALAVMACTAVISTALVVRREFGSRPARLTATGPQMIDGWQRYLEPGTRMGPATAAVTVIEFSDFQCEYCKQHAEHLDNLRRRYPNDLAIVVRHFPITDRHPHAYNAALSAECAGEQGRFAAYRSTLFRNQGAIGRTRWIDFAREAAVPDTTQFKRCMTDKRYAKRIQRDLRAGRDLGVPATPTSLINGMKVLGAADEQRLAQMVADALRASR